MRRSAYVKCRVHRWLCPVIIVVAGVLGGGIPAPAQSRGADISGDATPESLFTDFMHYARMGRFTLADSYAKALLEHPDLDPVVIMQQADRDPQSLETLLILIKRSTIGENAVRVLDLIEQGQDEKRKSAERIVTNIDLLGGDPQQELAAQERLKRSGEYAVPQILQTLLDPDKKRLWPRVINALPLIGKPAVNPLVIALAVRNNDVRLNLIQALGKIGYPQAIPYLRKLIADGNMPKQTRAAAQEAVARIENTAGRTFPGLAEDAFYAFAQRYFDEDDAVRADPRLDNANVWYFDVDAQALRRTPVPTRIFGSVMAMRCCEEALRLRNDHTAAIALWLAANTHRESRLGMDIESGDPNEKGEADATRPAVFPRALYFTQAAGPRYAHLMLDRAVRGHDSAVALGAIAALQVTAGETSLVGAEDYKQPLVKALQFSDVVVRTRASLALGAALPKTQFDGSQNVAPVLASALGQTGREQVLVIDADEDNANRVAGILREVGRDVIAETGFFPAFERARREMTTLTGIFISSGITNPPIGEVLRRLRGEFVHSKTPVVVLTRERHAVTASELAQTDPYVETVAALAERDMLEAAFERVRARTGQAPLDAKLARSMALQAAETLRRIVVDGRTVIDAGVAEPALIRALASDNEELQTLCASVLALLPTPTAQRAIAHVALSDASAESLRVAAFGSLAESAKNNGNVLEKRQVAELVKIARDDDNLTIRTAASQALGAVNLTTNQASDIIRAYYGG